VIPRGFQVIGSDLVYNAATAQLLAGVLRQGCALGVDCHLVLQDHARVHLEAFLDDIRQDLDVVVITEAMFNCEARNSNLSIYQISLSK